MKKLVYFALITIITTSTIFAQSEYVTEGQDTYSFSAGFQANTSSMPGFATLSTGFGMRGEYDIGFTLGIASVGKVYAPYFNLILRPRHSKSNNPFTFTLFVQPEFYSSSAISSKSTITAGGTTFFNLPMTSKSTLRPYVLAAYTNGSSDGTFSTGGGISFSYKGKKTIPVFKLGVITNSNNTSIIMSFSIVTIKG